MPVLPEVGSTMVPPGLQRAGRSASSTIDSAMRSLIEPPGLARSDLIQTCASRAEQAVDADVRRVADGLEDVCWLSCDLLRSGAADRHCAPR